MYLRNANLNLFQMILLILFTRTVSVSLTVAGCNPKDHVAWSASTFILGILVLSPAVAGTWIFWSYQEKKLFEHRRYIFEQNGGNLLMKKVSALGKPGKKNLKVLTAHDMRKATNNYRNKMEYKCRQGICYLGRLAGNDDTETDVVIMQIPRVPKSHINQFIDQIISLSKPHKNLVKIIGCCLETKNPLLVYEFHRERASLFNHVYDEDPVLHLSLEERVRAAAGAATALEYLHSQNSMTIVHGNVSSANILLDDCKDTKLFYAVASNMITPKVLSSEQEGYVHRPCKFSPLSSKLNERNDVYSFGWVLTELLTGWKTTPCPKNKVEQQMKEKIAMLAEKCLSDKPAKRPNMKSVKIELDKLMK